MAAKVTETTFNARKTLAITGRNDAVPMKGLANHTVIPYGGHVIQHIQKEDRSTGEIMEEFDSIIIATPDGELYATRSDSFMRSLREIIDQLAADNDTDPFALDVYHGKSNAGREYTTCSLYVD